MGTNAYARAACLALLAGAGALPARGGEVQHAAAGFHPRGEPFTVTSDPVALHVGEVFNDLAPPIKLPEHVRHRTAHGAIAVTAYKGDVVRFKDDNTTESTPLYDVYLHHYGAILGRYDDLMAFYEESRGRFNVATMPMSHVHSLFIEFSANRTSRRVASVGGGSGAEERKTPHWYPRPFAQVADEVDAFMPLMHLINTKDVARSNAGYSPLLECPCTKARRFDYNNHTIDGAPPNIPFYCSPWMGDNPSCSFDTYIQGYRCCENGVFVIEGHETDLLQGKVSNVGMSFTFWIEDVTSETRRLRAPNGCCDVTGDLTHFGNIEHDVTPACRAGDDCTQKFVGWQYLDVPPKHGVGFANAGQPKLTPEERQAIDAGREVEIVYAVGHQHVGGAGIKLVRDATDELICESKPIYGKSDAVGDERGYVVGMEPCVFGYDHGLPPPIRMRSDEVVRTESVYNTTYEHFGVMSLWLINVADVVPSSLSSDADDGDAHAAA